MDTGGGTVQQPVVGLATIMLLTSVAIIEFMEWVILLLFKSIASQVLVCTQHRSTYTWDPLSGFLLL